MVSMSKMVVKAGLIATFMFAGAGAALACKQPAGLDQLRREVIREVNATRAARRLPPLAQQVQLHQAAQGHACWMADMNKPRSHYGRGGSRPSDRARAQGYPSGYINENIAGGTIVPPKWMVAAWMTSPKHRDNILARKPRHIGVGIAEARGQRYWVLVGANTRR